MWIFARLMYGASRGILYGSVLGLVIGISVALFGVYNSQLSFSDFTRLMQTITTGFFSAQLWGALIGLFVPHNPRMEDLKLSKKNFGISISTSILTFLSTFIFLEMNVDILTVLFLEPNVNELMDVIGSNQLNIMVGIIISIFLGILIPPPRMLIPLVIQSITFGDVIRRKHPYHDEENTDHLSQIEHGQLHIQSAKWWSMRGQAPRARHEWSEARRLGGMQEDDYDLCVGFYAAIGNWNEAEKILREGINKFNESINLRLTLTDILESMELYSDEESVFQEIFALNPNHNKSHYAYGELLHKLTRYDEAIDYLERALHSFSSNDPIVVACLNSLGATYAQLGKFETAEGMFRKAIQLGSEFNIKNGSVPRGVKDAVRNLGMLHGTRKRYS